VNKFGVFFDFYAQADCPLAHTKLLKISEIRKLFDDYFAKLRKYI